MGLLSWLTGNEQAREAERQRVTDQAREQRESERQAAALEQYRQAEQKREVAEALHRERQQEPGPAERLLPGNEAVRAAVRGDKQPEKQREEEPTRLEYQPTPQPAPTIQGPGGPIYVNRRAQQPQQPTPELDPLAEAQRRLAERQPVQQQDRGRELGEDRSQGRSR